MTSSALDRIFLEIHRRKLLQAAGGYAIVCWFLLQVAATAFPLIGLSQAAVRWVLALALFGLPVVIGAAWLMGDAAPAGPPEHAGASAAAAVRADAVGNGRPVASAAPARRGLTGLLVGLLLLGAAAWGVRVRFPPPASARRARVVSPRVVAVLPLAVVSGDARDAYFGDGITEEIMNAVAQLPGLSLVARTSTFAFRDRAGELGAIRDSLGAGSVLEGSVQRSGERLRIEVALVDTESRRRVWSAQYDRRLRDVFALEDEIARSVAGALKVRLAPATPPHPATESVPAHDLYLLGLYHWNRRTGPEIQEAIGYFQRAAEADPAFGRAYAGLAAAYVLLPTYADVPGDTAYPRARAAAERALALDPALAEAQTALANVRMIYGWDWSGADAGFRRAIALDPSYATAHEWRALLLDALGRTDSAAAELRQAATADPMSHIITVVIGQHEALLGHYAAAAAVYRRVLLTQPDFPLAFGFLAQAEAMAGHPDTAAAALGRWADLLHVDRPSAEALARGGSAARAALARADVQRELKPFQLAVWSALAGDTAHALTWLAAAAARHDYMAYAVAVHPALRPLQTSPRYGALLERMGLRRR